MCPNCYLDMLERLPKQLWKAWSYTSCFFGGFSSLWQCCLFVLYYFGGCSSELVELFHKYYFGGSSSELAELFLLLFSRPTCYFDSSIVFFHESCTRQECTFHQSTGNLWSYLATELFTFSFDLWSNILKCLRWIVIFHFGLF